MKNKQKKKDIYILYLSELSQQKDRIKYLILNKTVPYINNTI